MRPFRSFLLLLIFLACFTGLYYIVPAKVNLPQLNVFLPAKLTGLFLGPPAPVKRGYGQFQSPEDVHLCPSGGQGGAFTQKGDSSQGGPFTKQIDSISFPQSPSSPQNSLISHHSVQSPAKPLLSSEHEGLSNVIDSLFWNKRKVRIMYYGDSQIEGDRITSSLRQLLRKGRNGTGPGLFLPLMPVMYTRSIYVRSSSNWMRFNYLSYRNGEIGTSSLGPFMTLCRYLPSGVRSDDPVKASVRIVPSEFADSAVAIYDNLRIIYLNNQEAINVRVSGGNKPITTDTLRVSDEIRELTVNLNKSRDILIEFEGHVSPDIFGMSIESDTGVVVDNLPQRGSAGMEFTMVGTKNLKTIYELLEPDLFILHYGLNVVRNVRDDYSYYENGLVRQLSLLKKISPRTRILVMSLTDMAFRERDSIKSFPNIPLIRDAQKRAAQKAKVDFWDTYEAMGGRSSAEKWADKDLPLFQKDYVHFTNRGADTLSKLLVKEMFTSPVIQPADTFLTVKEEKKPGFPGIINVFQMARYSWKPDTTIRFIKSSPDIRPKETILKTVSSLVFSYNPANPLIFTSPVFWVFFLFVLGGYSLVYRKLAVRNIYLFLISLFFYFKTGGLFLFLLIFVTIVDFTCGLLINRAERKWTRKFYLLLSLFSNLGLLAYFKYAGFIVESVNKVFGTNLKSYDLLSAFSNSILGTSFDITAIILPVGISFFTFQSLSYTIDVYRRKMEPVRKIIDFGFYVSFFPHLVAGPIVRASVFIPQIYQEFHLTDREFGHALFMISKGLIKKIVISNFIALNLVDRVFDSPALFSGFENLMAIYGYGLQIYCDFSGYTDIAIGVALILGFRLPVNFNSPYKATGIADFWKRWHISLSQWLKDYLYIPLGGNRKGKIRTYINLIITMLLGGLWHGASLRFIIWGALHGIGLAINKIWDIIFGNRLRSSRAGRILAIFITFQFVSFCWIFFRAENMENVFIMIRQIGQNFSPGSYPALLSAYGNVFILMTVGYVIHFLPENVKESYRAVFIRVPLVAQFTVIMLIAVVLYQLRTTEIMPFIYFRF